MIQCVCGGRVRSVSTDDRRVVMVVMVVVKGGGVMIKMVDVILSEGVGRRQEEKVRVSTLMLFVLGPVGLFAYSSGVLSFSCRSFNRRKGVCSRCSIVL